MKTIDVKVNWPGREEVALTFDLNIDSEILNPKLSGVGNNDLLALLRFYRPLLKGKVSDLPLPKGTTPADLCMREVLLKAMDKWRFPYKEEELCHCRAVPLSVVDQAICTGAHTSQKVSEQTSASTACGTCRPDVESVINYRLNLKN